MKHKKLVYAIVGIGYLTNFVFNIGQATLKVNKTEKIYRPVRIAQQRYEDLNSLKDYLNESGLKCLVEREQVLNQLKKENDPEIRQLNKKISKDIAEALLTKPGLWALGKIKN